MKKQTTIIIKKVKKGGHGGAHGGSWKVAYADFVTAMMAFFLLLWLISMVAPEKRARVSAYFKNYSIFDKSGTSFMDKSSEMFNESGESSEKALRDMRTENIHEMEKELKAGIMNKLGDAKDQVIVDTVEGGVRIQMTDKEGSLMFEKGSNKMTSKAQQIIRVIGENIKHFTNKVAIEGHTDALQYAGNEYSNWELSTDRASSARKELEANGLKAERIERVSGFADKDPLIADDTSDPRNRRISIIMKVPTVTASRSAVKTENVVINNKPENIAEKKDDGRIMVKKFEENLSIMKNGSNPADKKSTDTVVQEKTQPQPPPVTKEVISTQRSSGKETQVKEPEKRPALIKELNNPVISPVISKDEFFKN